MIISDHEQIYLLFMYANMDAAVKIESTGIYKIWCTMSYAM